jgi:hypothetical protein
VCGASWIRIDLKLAGDDLRQPSFALFGFKPAWDYSRQEGQALLLCLSRSEIQESRYQDDARDHRQRKKWIRRSMELLSYYLQTLVDGASLMKLVSACFSSATSRGLYHYSCHRSYCCCIRQLFRLNDSTQCEERSNNLLTMI